jgi:hypothetical protein
VSKRNKANVHKLADELIELRCDPHSVGNVYEWFLKAYRDANKAKAEFIRFISGELPTRILDTASEWIADEQGYERDTGNYDAHPLAASESLVIPDPLEPRAFQRLVDRIRSTSQSYPLIQHRRMYRSQSVQRTSRPSQSRHRPICGPQTRALVVVQVAIARDKRKLPPR